MTKTKVELGGITGGLPDAPYPRAGGMTISRRPPIFIPMMASLKPGTTPESGKVAGPLSVQDASKTFPVVYRAPTYWTSTVAPGPAI